MKRLWITLLSVLLLAACHDSDEPAPEDNPNGTLPKLRTVSLYIRDGLGVFTLSSVTAYFYSPTGRFERTEGSLYNSTTKELFPYSQTTLTYNESGRVSRLEAAITNTTVKETVQYQYDDTGRVTRMFVDSSNAIADIEISVTYEPGDTLQAFYQYDNGDSFTYRVWVREGNVAYEKTINSEHKISSELASSFDDRVNPYNQLGYMDHLFTNYSKNNKLAVASKFYIGSAEATPEFYDYTYNSNGLPLTQLVTLKSHSEEPQTPHLKYVFEYDQ